MATRVTSDRAHRLHDLISRSEDDLIERVLAYARRQDYTRYTSTLAEAWRGSIVGLSCPMLAALERSDQVPELTPDEDYAQDPVAAFGILEAQRHRARGIGLGMFLGLMKYYRQSYTDLVASADFAPVDGAWAQLYVRRIFDRVELGYCTEWAALSEQGRVDELQATNRQLANEKNKYLTLFSSLGPPVLLLDRDDRITDMNFAAEQLFLGARTPGHTYYGASVRGLLPPSLAEAVESFRVDGRPQLRTLVTVGRGAMARDFDVLLDRMLDVSGKFEGVTIVLNDVTERLRLQRELSEARDELERRVAERTAELRHALESLHEETREKERVAAEQRRLEQKVREVQRLESLGVLAGGIAHDFNNLLTTILGNAELVDRELPESAPQHERLHHVEVAARHASDLCRQMLAYSGRGALERRRIDLVELSRDMTDLMQASIAKSIVLRTRLAGSLHVRGDASQLRQVVLNLVVNAAEAIGERDGTIELGLDRVRLTRRELDATALGHELDEGEYVALRVSDDGCGMDEATRARIFDPFFSTKFVGRGLGLAVVMGIVRGHDGTIDIQSQPGAGTTVRIWFPLSGEADADPARDVRTRSVIEASGGWRTALLVDDDPMVRQVTTTLLESGGWRVLGASGGQHALERWSAEREAIALLVIDVSMPGMDGPATLAALRELGCEAPALLVSGYDEARIDARTEGLGVAAVLHKPFDRATLLRTAAETQVGVL